MMFPTTIEGLSPAFLTRVLGRPALAVARVPLGEPYTSRVAALDVTFTDGSRRQLVAKVPRPGQRDLALYEREVHFYREVARRLDCVPRPVFAEIGADGQFLLILEQMAGHHPAEGMDEPTARAALRAIARVHGACWDDPSLKEALAPKRHGPDDAGRLLDTMHTRWDDVVSRFPRHLDRPPPIDSLASEVLDLRATTLTHNDLHAENVLVDGDRIGFVDWQNAAWSTPMVDVANVLAGCTRPEVQRSCWRALLDGYQEALVDAGGPELPDLVARYATGTALLFGWVMRYLAGVSDEEAASLSLLLVHWERVCAGVLLPR